MVLILLVDVCWPLYGLIGPGMVGCSCCQLTLLTYSIYFSYAIFLTDYKKILKIAGGVKQLTVPLLPDPNCSMPENDAQCVIPVSWINNQQNAVFLSKQCCVPIF